MTILDFKGTNTHSIDLQLVDCPLGRLHQFLFLGIIAFTLDLNSSMYMNQKKGLDHQTDQ